MILSLVTSLLFQIANKILDFLVQLRELGYPSHLTDVTRNGLKCNDEEADQIVSYQMSLHFCL